VDQRIFFAIIILFTIIDSVARTKKKRASMQAPPVPGEHPTRAEWREDIAAREAERVGEDADTSSPVTTSESMIPADIWEEIAALTEGRRQARPGPQPQTRPKLPVRAERPLPPSPPPPSRSRRTAPGEQIHLSHREYGTDPSQRSRSEQDGLDPLARSLGADEATTRQQLRGRKKHALRQAVILQEILGSPVALRTDRLSDF
jgi:hypothetical protein